MPPLRTCAVSSHANWMHSCFLPATSKSTTHQPPTTMKSTSTGSFTHIHKTPPPNTSPSMSDRYTWRYPNSRTATSNYAESQPHSTPPSQPYPRTFNLQHSNIPLPSRLQGTRSPNSAPPQEPMLANYCDLDSCTQHARSPYLIPRLHPARTNQETCPSPPSRSEPNMPHPPASKLCSPPLQPISASSAFLKKKSIKF